MCCGDVPPDCGINVNLYSRFSVERKELEGRRLMWATVPIYYEQKSYVSLILRTVCCFDLSLLFWTTILVCNVAPGKGKSWVSKLIQEGHFSAMTKYHFAKPRPWVQSNKCCSAVLTDHWSSGTRCHKGIAEVQLGSLLLPPILLINQAYLHLHHCCQSHWKIHWSVHGEMKDRAWM